MLSELCSIVDSVTGESFEVLRGVSPQLDTAWGTASARMKMVLEAESQTQNADLGKTYHGRLEEATDRNAYMAVPSRGTPRTCCRARTD